MFITIINDCADGNALGRQSTRVAGLFGVTPTFIPVAGTLDDAAQLEASGNLVDVLDAAHDTEGVVLVNVAPRNGTEHHWENGTPFGTFKVGAIRVITSISGLTLALPHKLGLVQDLCVFDIPATVDRMHARGMIDRTTADRIAHSQFRSLDFLPRVAYFLSQGGEPVTTPHQDTIGEIGARVWTVDNFGNLKTTITTVDIVGMDTLKTIHGTFPIVHQLKDVPENGEVMATLGSSGYNDIRFVELVIQGESATKKLSLPKGAVL
jgi:hypothetical protein